MSDQLAAAAAAMNVPETLVQRSAEARAKATGASVDEILAAWAGGGSAPAAPSPAAEPEPAPEPEADATPEPAGAPEPTPTVRAAPAPPPQPATAPAPPTPERVSPQEALSYPVVVSVPTAGLTERTSGALPRWLAAAFFIVPLFGLLYLTSNIDTTGCVEGGFELAVDRVTGAVENCDGSEFEGRGGLAGPGGAFLADGGQLYTSAGCAGCHGPNGGGGTGPAFTNVVVTFGSCADHIEWVRLGSAGFQAMGRSTYGDVAKPISGGMPPHEGLTEEQIASVVGFERVAFGGGNADEVLVDCGLVEPAEGDGESGEGEGGEGEGGEGGAETPDETTATTAAGEAQAGGTG